MNYYSAPSVYGEVPPINMTDNRTVGVLLVGINAVLYFAVPGNQDNTSLFYTSEPALLPRCVSDINTTN